MDGAPAKVVLLAHPAGHSLSPSMHNAAFEAAGLEARYEAEDVPPARLPAAVARLAAAPYLGANVSVPHKEAVLELLDELTPPARSIGAVNTIVRRGENLVGHNTDGAGFLRALGELRGVTQPEVEAPQAADLGGATCLVLGAGGAARAVVHALLGAGAHVLVCNRNADRAARLVRDMAGSDGEGPEVAEEPAAVLPRTDLLVNTTSVGMHGGPDPHGLPLIQPRQLNSLPGGALVIDLVYRPALTPLLAAAKARGLAHQNGLPMLVWQGALAFEAWTGVPAPVGAMRAAAERGLVGEPG